jgi:DNA repair exonuclease SbcCD nuclease subunit
MQVCILGDLHFGVRNDNLKFHEYYRRFYTNILFPFLKKNNITKIIQLGDMFDRRKYINFNTLYLARQYFFDVAKDNNIEIYMFLGNHDVFHKNTLSVNSPQLLLGEYKNVHIIDRPTEIEFDNQNIALVPWMCQDNEEEVLEFLGSSKSKVCMGHFEIQGFEMHKGHVCETGFDRSSFRQFDVTLSGHYHTRSQKDGITYVGTPYELTWADYNDPKGFHTLDTDTLDLTFIQNPYRMFNKVKYDDSNIELSELLNKDFDALDGSFTKVIVSQKTNPYWFDLFIDNIEKSGVAHIQIVNDVIIDDDVDNDSVDETQDTLSILSTYVSSIDVDVDKDLLMGLVRELYSEALNS